MFNKSEREIGNKMRKDGTAACRGSLLGICGLRSATPNI
jgi:hypothetical protein